MKQWISYLAWRVTTRLSPRTVTGMSGTTPADRIRCTGRGCGHVLGIVCVQWVRRTPPAMAKFSLERTMARTVNPSPHRLVGDIQNARGVQIFDVAI